MFRPQHRIMRAIHLMKPRRRPGELVPPTETLGQPLRLAEPHDGQRIAVKHIQPLDLSIRLVVSGDAQ